MTDHHHRSAASSVATALAARYAALLIVLLAAFLRLHHLPELPPGLNFDEAGNGVAALDILNGAPQLWWQIGGGKEPLWPYLVALSTALLGQAQLALRLPATFIGVLTVAVIYPLGRALFPGRYLPALLAMLGVALSSWHLHFSRLGFRAIWLPLLSTLALYFFWRSLAAHRSRFGPLPAWSLAALFTALAIYAYLAARLLPLVFLIYFLRYWLIQRFRPLAPNSMIRNSPIRNSLLPTFGLLILFLLPLLVHFAFNPADLTERAATVSIFNPQWHNGDLPGAAWRTLRLTLGTFLALSGDANPLVNLPGQPALSLLPALFFGLGQVDALRRLGLRILRPNQSRCWQPHLLLLGWWWVMLLPAILAPEGAPHHLRLIGVLVPTYFFVALGLTLVVDGVGRWGPAARHLRPAYWLPLLVFLLVGWQSYANYFWRWPNAIDFTLPFDRYAVRLAADIAQAPADVGYVLPMDIRAGREARHYTLDYLLAGASAPDYRYILVDERNAEAGLTAAAASSETLRVVRWTADKHIAADEKEIVMFLLETQAQFQERQTFPVYQIEIYRLPPNGTFALPPIGQPLGANFDDLLRLDAVFVPPAATPGGWLPVAMTAAPLASMPVDYKASLRLTGPSGQRVAQKDRTLRHNFHQGTSLWPPESVNEYYLLSVPPEAPPGVYTVSVVIYHPDTLAPLVADGLAELPLGTVRVE